MKEFIQKNLLIHLGMIAIGLIFSWVLFFTPVFNGKTLSQSDNSSSIAMAKEVSDFEEQTGETSMWTNSMFGGMPTYMIKGNQDNNIFRYVSAALKFGLPYTTVSIFFTYFLFLYFFFVAVKMKPLEAFLGAIMFALSSYNVIIIEAGHITKAYAIGYTPIILTGVVLALRNKYLLGGIITCIGLGVQLYSNHFQITYYTGIIVGLLIISWLVYAIQKKEIAQWLKGTSVIVIASAFAVLPNTSHLWTTYEYQKETMRGGSDLVADSVNVQTVKPTAADSAKVKTVKPTGLEKKYAFDWSQGKSETFTLLIPRFMGGGSGEELDESSNAYEAMIQNNVPTGEAKKIIKSAPTYRGDQPFTSGAIYFGCIIVFLAVLGFVLIKGPIRWWLIAGTVVSICLAWGRNLPSVNYFLFDHLPLYNKFRSVSMWLALTSLLAVVSAVLGVHEYFNNPDEKNKKLLMITYGVVGGLCLFFGLFGSEFFDFTAAVDAKMVQGGYPQWLVDAFVEDRADMLQSDALKSFALISLAFGALFLFYKKVLKAEIAIVAICLISLLDLYKFDKSFISEDKFSRVKKSIDIVESSADKQILEDKDPNFRVLNTATDTYNDAYTSYFHKSVGGYHPAKLKRYQDMIERHISQQNLSVLNMLNTKYVIQNQQGQLVVFKNDRALGNAWFIDTLKVVNTPNEEIAALNAPFESKTTAVIDTSFYAALANKKDVFADTGEIKLTSYKPNELIYTSNNPELGFAVFSEIYYKDGWQASIDGKEVDHLRVNYILRALEIPAGKHEIKFVFAPESFVVGSKISGISSIVVLVILLLSVGVFVYKRKKA
ncbi:MAG: YfhO family protein [Bacteroidetes bacterium]|nr:YfhO family protein [Bacteroidota bacterium]